MDFHGIPWNCTEYQSIPWDSMRCHRKSNGTQWKSMKSNRSSLDTNLVGPNPPGPILANLAKQHLSGLAREPNPAGLAWRSQLSWPESSWPRLPKPAGLARLEPTVGSRTGIQQQDWHPAAAPTASSETDYVAGAAASAVRPNSLFKKRKSTSGWLLQRSCLATLSHAFP